MGTIEYYSDLDLGGNELKNVIIDTVATLPTASASDAGRFVYYNGALYFSNGTTYIQLAAGANKMDAIATYTGGKVVVSGADATHVVETAVTTTEIGYVSGVTSAIQTQLNGKVDKLTTGPTADTYTKVTVTADGLVSSGTTLEASDIPTGIAQSKITDLTTDLAAKIPKIGSGSTTADQLVKSNADGTVTIDTDSTTKLAGIAPGAQVNVIESITVDNVAQTITNKVVALDLSAYAKTSDLTAVYKYKGTCTYATLPTTGQVQGDVWNVTDAHGTTPAGTNYAWDGTAWDPLAGTVDLSPYLLSATASSTYVPKTVTVNGHALSENVTVTASDVGLGNVDNTSDANKPISTATQTALDGKMAKFSSAPTGGKIVVTVANDDDAVVEGSLVASTVATAIADASTSGSILNTVAAGYVAKNGTDRLMTAAEGTKLEGIATGAQVNVIETVKVNGTALTPDANKAVDVTVPTDNASLTNGAGYQTASEVSTAIGTALNSYYTQTTVDAMFGETALTFSSNVATVSASNVWTAEVLTSTGNKVVYAEVVIGASSVTVTVADSTKLPTGGLKLRYIKKPVQA